MAHDLASLITVLDGILHPTDQDDHKKPLVESVDEKSKNLLKKSVITVLDRIRRCTDQEDGIHKKLLLKSLLEKATSLKNLLEESAMQHHSPGRSSARYKEIVEALQSEIRDAAHEAEDIIESRAMGRMLSKPYRSVRKAMEKFDSANDELTKIINDDQNHEEEALDHVIINPSLSAALASDSTSSKPKIAAMVGFEEDALHLKHRLTSSQRSAREIIPIVGMGGIGKTTLVRNLYNDPLIVSHFDNHRAWVTVSQDYNMRAILLGLLGCLFGEISGDMLRQNNSELGLTLYQRLYGRRYLIVLDDIWSEKVWDELNRYFPNENNRSRILITSRELGVAKYPDSACEEHQMHLLNSAQSWDLLCHKVFDAKKEERCPPFLEEIGHKIVRDCGGLPLAISVIGGLLSVDKYSKDLWEKVAKDVSSSLSQRDEHFSKILWLSYDNLPLHLKPCFLYMAAFPEDFEVKGSKLVKLWVAEGFLWRPGGNNKSLEDVGEEYLKALVDRNLLSVADTYYVGRAKSYSMHDLLRDICVRKADEEKFLCVVKNEKVPRFRRASAHIFTEDAPHMVSERLSLSRSLLCITPQYHNINISHMLSTLRLVRILDMHNIELNQLPRKILKLVNLRFLAVKCRKCLPSRIWRMRNLQTLISDYFNSEEVTLPNEAWEIPSLRHIKINIFGIDFKIPRAHENLQTIYGVRLADFLASNLINSIPNVKKLGIRVDREYGDIVIDLSHLHKLETLKFVRRNPFRVPTISPIKLPNCLKKVSLVECLISERLLNDVVGSLPYLEVLKIRFCQFLSKDRSRKEWELDEGVEFCSLQFLELHSFNIACWKADDSSHFPMLRHLKIQNCIELKEMPTSIGEIPTLEIIELDNYNRFHVAWATEVHETQRDYGNESLQIKDCSAN